MHCISDFTDNRKTKPLNSTKRTYSGNQTDISLNKHLPRVETPKPLVPLAPPIPKQKEFTRRHTAKRRNVGIMRISYLRMSAVLGISVGLMRGMNGEKMK